MKYVACKDCQNRQPGCHSYCENYKKFVEENERIKAERQKSKKIYVARTSHIPNILKRR